jgi:lipopolysaccharide export system protein LptA
MKGLLVALGAAVLIAAPLAAQQAPRPGAPNTPQGLAGSGPISIDADRLEVRDRDKTAVFSGNVVAKRGDALVRATAMTVFYDGDATPGAQRAPAAPGQGQQNIRRIEMAGRVFFQQRDQQATGDSAVYERANETLTLRGNVVLTQGENVINGTTLRVNLRTNQAVVEGRVRSILVPNSQANPEAPGVPAPRR